MGKLTLVIGNKNYSSWSLRPWLLMRHAGIPFEEVRIPLYNDATRDQIHNYSPSGKIPVLLDGERRVWDSLAICEYIAELYPQHQLWPVDLRTRAVARSVCAEMHSGFMALRENMTMNCRKLLPGKGRGPGVAEDIARITAVWTDCRKRLRQGGDFLFGHFSIADAMYAPVALRFHTYAVDLDPVCAAYAKTLLELPAVQDWVVQSHAEPEVLPAFER